MPRWLQIVAHVNPLTYEVDALRAVMLVGTGSLYGLGVDFGILVGVLSILVMVGARVYPRVAT
jgi:ABC-2 type transport system permease protein